MGLVLCYNLDNNLLETIFQNSSDEIQTISKSNPIEFLQECETLKYSGFIFNLDSQESLLLANRICYLKSFSTYPKVALSPLPGSPFQGLLYEMGIDDFIELPFPEDLLSQRIIGKIRRFDRLQWQGRRLKIEDVVIDLLNQCVVHIKNEEEVDLQLTPNEVKILGILAEQGGEILSRDYLISRVWGESQKITDRTVDTHLSAIRKKLLKTSVKIETIYGLGYRIRFEDEEN